MFVSILRDQNKKSRFCNFGTKNQTLRVQSANIFVNCIFLYIYLSICGSYLICDTFPLNHINRQNIGLDSLSPFLSGGPASIGSILGQNNPYTSLALSHQFSSLINQNPNNPFTSLALSHPLSSLISSSQNNPLFTNMGQTNPFTSFLPGMNPLGLMTGRDNPLLSAIGGGNPLMSMIGNANPILSNVGGVNPLMSMLGGSNPLLNEINGMHNGPSVFQQSLIGSTELSKKAIHDMKIKLLMSLIGLTHNSMMMSYLLKESMGSNAPMPPRGLYSSIPHGGLNSFMPFMGINTFPSNI